VCDIRDEAGVIAVINAVLSERGRIDGLVNNAGGQYRSPLKDISTRGFEAVVRSNLTGGFIVMREVYNRWMRHNGGSIVNMIDIETHDLLRAIWKDFGGDRDLRVAVITGTGDAFCAGADLKTHVPEWDNVGPAPQMLTSRTMPPSAG
jgi:citronellol/citronellal dehydrogenase